MYNTSYTNKGILIKLSLTEDLIVKLNKKQSTFILVRFLIEYAPDCVLLYTHIMDNLLCALHCLILSALVAHSQLWGQRCPDDKSSFVKIQFTTFLNILFSVEE